MSDPEAFGFGSFRLMSQRRELLLNGDSVQLGSRAFDLLLALVRRQGQLATKDELMAEVWPGTIVEENSLHAQISALRKVLAGDPDSTYYLQTIPGRGYRFVARVEHVTADHVTAPTASSAAPLPLPDKPSIAVLPFTNMSGGPGQEYFADGIVEDIITELSRFGELFVIARNSSFQYKCKAVDVRQIGRELGVRYVLEGSVRRAGGRIRISAQLIDAVTGGHRWAERYDRALRDVFAVQDEIARTIVATVASHVNRAEAERTLLKPPGTWVAYDYFLRAVESYRTFQRPVRMQTIDDTRRSLDQCLAIDPNYARAHALKSATLTSTYSLRLNGDYFNPSVLGAAFEAASKAVELDPHLPEAHGQLGYVLGYKGLHEAAIAEFEQAFALNPNFTDWRFTMALVWAGQAERAIEVARAHWRLDPDAYAIAQGYCGLAHLVLKRHEDALPLLREFVARSINHLLGMVWLASLYGHLGRLEDAGVQIRSILRIDPDWTIEDHQRPRARFWCAEYAAHVEDGLRKAWPADR